MLAIALEKLLRGDVGPGGVEMDLIEDIGPGVPVVLDVLGDIPAHRGDVEVTTEINREALIKADFAVLEDVVGAREVPISLSGEDVNKLGVELLGGKTGIIA